MGIESGLGRLHHPLPLRGRARDEVLFGPGLAELLRLAERNVAPDRGRERSGEEGQEGSQKGRPEVGLPPGEIPSADPHVAVGPRPRTRGYESRRIQPPGLQTVYRHVRRAGPRAGLRAGAASLERKECHHASQLHQAEKGLRPNRYTVRSGHGKLFRQETAESH